MKVSCNNCQVRVINGHVCHEQACYEPTIYKKRNKSFIKFEVITLDVWGNEKEGYEVNNAFTSGQSFIVPENATDKLILKHVKALGYLNKKTKFSSLVVHGENDLYIDWQKRGNNSPCLQLRRL